MDQTRLMRRVSIFLMSATLVACGGGTGSIPPASAQSNIDQVNTTTPQTLSNKTLDSTNTYNGGSFLNTTLTSPTVTGTVAGSATYTTPTMTSPTVTGTVSGSATYSAPTLDQPLLIGYATAALPATCADNTLVVVTDGTRGLRRCKGNAWLPTMLVQPEDFGGTTATAIQAAMDAVGAQGSGQVWLTGSSYSLGTTGLVFNYSGVTVHCVSESNTVLTYTGSGSAVGNGDPSSTKSYVSMENCTVDLRSATSGAIGLDWNNIGNSTVRNVFVNGTGNTVIPLKLTGDVTKSTYWNQFYNVHLIGNTTAILISGLANANTFWGGLLEGTGKAIEILPQAGHNTDSIHFFGTALQTTGATMVHLGTASGGAGASGNLFERLRMEPGTPVSFTIDSGAASNVIAWPLQDGNVTFSLGSVSDQNVILGTSLNGLQYDAVLTGAPKKTVNLRGSGAGITFENDSTANLYLGAAGVVQSDGSVNARQRLRASAGGAQEVSILAAEVAVTGSNTNQSLYLEAKGTGAVLANSQNGATGGLGITAPGATGVLLSHQVSVTAVAGATLTATNAIPAGSVVIGVTTAVTTALGTSTGLTSYQVGDGTTADKWAATGGLTLASITDSTSFKAGATMSYYPAATNVVLTANGGNFDNTGAVRVSVFYYKLSD